MFTPHLTDDQFDRYILDILRRELDSPGLARYLRLRASAQASTSSTWIDNVAPEDCRRDCNSSPLAATRLKKA